jgi:Tol biopolymer transport system component
MLSGLVVKWSSSNPTIARVSTSGLVTTAALGVDTVVAEASGKQGSAVLTIAPKQIVLTPRLPSLFVADTIQLMAVVTDANDTPIDAAPVRWQSRDPGFATVSSAGVVSGVAAGRAIVSASAATGRDSVLVVVLSPSVRPNREVAFLTDSAQIGASQLHTIWPDGSGDTRVSGAGEYVTEYDWSPAGSQLAVVYVLNNGQGNPGLYVMNADGSNPVRIADAEFNPRWSPDGSTVAFRNEISTGQSDIYVIGATGLGLRRLTTQSGDEILPAWSPDGRRIAYMHSTGGPWELWVMDSDGNHQQHISLPTAALHPRWSPDGKLIAFDSGVGIWLVNADGSGVRPLTANCMSAGTCTGTASYTDPAWSNDAKRLAYSAYDQVSQHRSVVVSSVGGTELARVDAAACCALSSTLPDWSPDDSGVAYGGTRSTPPPWPGVLVMNPDGTGLRFLTGPQNASTGRWRP